MHRRSWNAAVGRGRRGMRRFRSEERRVGTRRDRSLYPDKRRGEEEEGGRRRERKRGKEGGGGGMTSEEGSRKEKSQLPSSQADIQIYRCLYLIFLSILLFTELPLPTRWGRKEGTKERKRANLASGLCGCELPSTPVPSLPLYTPTTHIRTYDYMLLLSPSHNHTSEGKASLPPIPSSSPSPSLPSPRTVPTSPSPPPFLSLSLPPTR